MPHLVVAGRWHIAVQWQLMAVASAFATAPVDAAAAVLGEGPFA